MFRTVAGRWPFFSVLSLLSALVAAPGAFAAEMSFDTWLAAVRDEGVRRGLKPATLDSALKGIKPIPRVIELDRRQPEFTLTFEQYMNRVVSQRRVKKGRRKLDDNRALLTRIGAKYRVQPRFIVALWGIETDFGRISGGCRVIPALATLAFDGRRAAYFRKELFNALTIIDQGHITAAAMTGSWAGAMGQNQFMPSSFLKFAVDEDGDGKRDIWSNHADVFASTANYLRGVGWRDDQTWGRAVRVPDGFDAGQIGLKVKKRLSAWQDLGVRRADGGNLPARDLVASLVRPKEGARALFLVYGNYRAILKWNRAHLFATAVGRLADQIGGG